MNSEISISYHNSITSIDEGDLLYHFTTSMNGYVCVSGVYDKNKWKHGTGKMDDGRYVVSGNKMEEMKLELGCHSFSFRKPDPKHRRFTKNAYRCKSWKTMSTKIQAAINYKKEQ